MKNQWKKIWNIISTIIVAFTVLCAAFLMGTRLFGYRCYTVISGSMEPKYSVGDLIYVKEVDPADIKVGDDITFILNEDLVVATHRVVRIDVENQHFYTKGLANEVEDSEPVHFNNVIGVPQFSIPKLGYVSDFVQNPPGLYITLGVVIALVLLVFLPDMVRSGKKAEQGEAALDDSNQEAMLLENQKLKAELEKLREKMEGKQTE